MPWTPTTDFPAIGVKVTRAQLQTEVKGNLDFLHDPPSARVYRTTVQSIPNFVATHTPIGFDAERYDTDTIHDTATNNSRLTAKTAGKYNIFGHVEWTDTSSGGYRQLGILLNGTTFIAMERIASIEAADSTQAIQTVQSIATTYHLALNDWVELTATQNGGGPIDIAVAANFSPEFGMTWISG